MPDLYPVIFKAISALPENNLQNREFLYERARLAVKKAFMSEDEHESRTQQELNNLEEVISRIEVHLAGREAVLNSEIVQTVEQPNHYSQTSDGDNMSNLETLVFLEDAVNDATTTEIDNGIPDVDRDKFIKYLGSYSSVFMDENITLAGELGIASSVILFQFLIILWDQRNSIFEYLLPGNNTYFINTPLVLTATLALMNIISIPRLVTKLIISSNRKSISALYFHGADELFIIRMLQRTFYKVVWRVLKKTLALEFSVYIAITLLFSTAYSFLHINIFEALKWTICGPLIFAFFGVLIVRASSSKEIQDIISEY